MKSHIYVNFSQIPYSSVFSIQIPYKNKAPSKIPLFTFQISLGMPAFYFYTMSLEYIMYIWGVLLVVFIICITEKCRLVAPRTREISFNYMVMFQFLSKVAFVAYADFRSCCFSFLSAIRFLYALEFFFFFLNIILGFAFFHFSIFIP